MNDKAVGLLHTARQMPMALADRKGTDSAVLGVRLGQKKENAKGIKTELKELQTKHKKFYVAQNAELEARMGMGLTDGVQKDRLNAAEEEVKCLSPTHSKGEGDVQISATKPRGRKVNAVAEAAAPSEKPVYKGRVVNR